MEATREGLVTAVLVAGGVLVALIHPGVATALLALGLGLLGWQRLRGGSGSEPRPPDLARLVEEHRLLHESIETNPMPFALYDRDDRLIAWNEAYELTHEAAFRRLRPQAERREIRYPDLVRITAEATLPPEEVEAHVAHRVERQRQADGVGVDREYPGLGWLRVSKFITPSGAVAGFAIDINELKQREAELERQIARSNELEIKLRLVADTDALTGIPNRRCFLARAEAEFQRARRYGSTLGIVMMDVDRFKSFNDRHGHEIGDMVLVQVAETAASLLRADIDLIGRLGGEEFAVLLPETDRAGAKACAERIRAAIAALPLEGGGERLQVTVSLGATELTPADAAVAALLHRADRALYVAKDAGRDRVVTAEEDAPGVNA